jgi:hypothetical protein
MKHLLLTTIAAVLLVGCGKQPAQTSTDVETAEPVAEAAQPEPATAKVPDISIHDAAGTGNIEAVKQHLAAGTDVNVKDNIGLTPLHMAAGDGRKEVAELLITKGADVNSKNDGGTPLDLANLTKQTEIIDILRKHGGKEGEPDDTHDEDDGIGVDSDGDGFDDYDEKLTGLYRTGDVMSYSGCCDGSGSVALNDECFVVANDEDSTIRVYRRNVGKPIAAYDCKEFLNLKKKDEPDLEAVARIKDRLYFIGSHSRSKKGKKREDRSQFFAMKFRIRRTTVELNPIGQPYTDLVEDLENAASLKHLEFDDAAEEDGDNKKGLNIEGLCSTPSGHLLVGFRGPIRGGKAIIVTLRNPDELLDGKPADWGLAFSLDLDGMGIRGLGRVGTEYILIGERPKGGKGAVYVWDGVSSKPRRLQVALGNSDPESVVVYPGQGSSVLQLLLDDGNTEIGDKDCKELKDPSRRHFRSLWLNSN